MKNLYQQDTHLEQIKDLNVNLNHLSEAITGLLRRVQHLESSLRYQKDVNAQYRNLFELFADELDLLIQISDEDTHA